MSSHEFLELIEFMPDEGAFKTAARGGEYSERDQVWRSMATEMAKLRATTHAVYGGERYAPIVFPTLAELRDQVLQAEAQTERREAAYSFADRTPESIGR